MTAKNVINVASLLHMSFNYMSMIASVQLIIKAYFFG